MKVYILQENYIEIDPEGRWDDESGGYESEEYKCRDVIGVFTTLEDAVRRMVDVYTEADSSYARYRDSMDGYEIILADTETNKKNTVRMDEYRDMATQMKYDKELGEGVVTINSEAKHRLVFNMK